MPTTKRKVAKKKLAARVVDAPGAPGLAFETWGFSDVSTMPHFGHTSFLVGEKVFAFTRKDGVALKLPRTRAQELIEAGEAVPLVMGKRVMTEWIILHRDDASDYKNDRALFAESIAFVASPQKPGTRKRK